MIPSDMKKLFLTFFFILSCTEIIFSIEIPIEESVINNNLKGANIAFVDIDAIFAQHPMTKRLKEEFQADAKKRKDEIKRLESEVISSEGIIISSHTQIDALKWQLEILTSTRAVTPSIVTISSNTALPGIIASTSTVNTSSVQISSPTAQFTVQASTLPVRSTDEIIREIKDKETEIEKLKQETNKKKGLVYKLTIQHKEDLKKLEEAQTTKVLADIYHILEKIAQEDNLTIIVDKNNVLYGLPAQDVTNKVIDMLRGR